jgi:hypothetical protein
VGSVAVRRLLVLLMTASIIQSEISSESAYVPPAMSDCDYMTASATFKPSNDDMDSITITSSFFN